MGGPDGEIFGPRSWRTDRAQRGGSVTQRHNELTDLEAELLSMVCSDVEIGPVLQDISGEQLENRGSNRCRKQPR